MIYEYVGRCGRLAADILHRELCGCVIAVHSESVYIRVPGGRLLLICPDKYGIVPFGISVPEYALLREQRSYIEGESVRINSGRLVFDDGTEISFAIEYGIAAVSGDVITPELGMLAICAEYVEKNASLRGIGPALPAFLCMGTPRSESNIYALGAAAEADRLEEALCTGSGDMLSRALCRYIGLGYGLTPSGDDFVCGMAYAFSYLGRASCTSRKYLDMLSEAAVGLIDRTNEVSAEYIRCALDGEYFSIVEDALVCICSSGVDRTALERALGSLLRVGASSGSDILCGMLFAFYILLQ